MSTTTSAPPTVEQAAPRPADRFAPDRDGIIGIYALRLIARGEDPRQAVASHRATRYGLGPSRAWLSAAAQTPALVAVGRAAQPVSGPASSPELTTAETPLAVAAIAHQPAVPARVRRLSLPTLAGLSQFVFGPPSPAPARQRRLVTAGLALTLVLGTGAFSARAQEAPGAETYVVQPGDTLGTVAERFGVDPLALAAASGLAAIDTLAPDQVLVIPSPAADAALAPTADTATTGVIDEYVVAEGDTLATIASWFGVPLDALLATNGIVDPEQLAPGDRLLIPLVEPVAADPALSSELAAFQGQPAPATDAVSAVPVEPVVEIAGVPAYQQAYPLSSEFAAAFIATSAFGAGIPEAVFVDAVPLSENPHWGYRGNLAGQWGNTTDYGVYAEPLVPVLNANGFQADVFYAAGDPAALTARLDAGLPVITWLGFYGDTAYTVADEGAGTYELAAGMHAVVVYGYDAGGVLVSDPLSGNYQQYDWDTFLAAWDILEGMSLAVAPY